MANSGVQLLGFALSLVGIIGLIAGTVLPQWKMSAYVGDSIITAVATYQGLWMSCAFQSTGQLQCKIYDSILQLDGVQHSNMLVYYCVKPCSILNRACCLAGRYTEMPWLLAMSCTMALAALSVSLGYKGSGNYPQKTRSRTFGTFVRVPWKGRQSKAKASSALQATRALMIVGIIMSIAGLGVACIGMKCTTCGGDDKVRKARTAMTGGIILLVGAFCAIVACSWFAHNVIRAFYNPLTPINSKFEFGAAIFIAWGGSFLDVLGGAMLAASCPQSKQVSKYPQNSTRPSSSNKEYV